MTAPEIAVAILTVAIFSILAIAVTPILFWHGYKGGALVGWGTLLVFCAIRILGSGLQIVDRSNPWILIVNSIGVSLFLLANAGLMYEARFYLFESSDHGARYEVRDALWTICTHIVLVGAQFLIAPGVLGFSEDTDPERIRADWNLCGMASVVIMIVLGATTVRACRIMPAVVYNPSKQQEDAMRLLQAVKHVCLVYWVYAIATVIFFFSRDLSMSPVGGNWLGRVFMYLLPEVGATVALISTGWKTRHMGKEGSTGITEVIEMR